MTAPPKYKKAKITLNDCLACSGCITSAEAVLVNQQSRGQKREVVDDRLHIYISHLTLLTRRT